MYAGQNYLTDEQNLALIVATCLLTERCQRDITLLAAGVQPDADGGLLHDDNVLPPRFRTFYDLVFAERLLAVLMTVGWKLANRETDDELACVAEEMMLSAVIDEGVGVHNGIWELEEFEEDGTDEDGQPVPERIELSDMRSFGPFEDLDFELLWMDRFDGIQDSDIGRMMGISRLDVREWFDPFVDRGPVHPMAVAPDWDWTSGPKGSPFS